MEYRCIKTGVPVLSVRLNIDSPEEGLFSLCSLEVTEVKLSKDGFFLSGNSIPIFTGLSGNFIHI